MKPPEATQFSPSPSAAEVAPAMSSAQPDSLALTLATERRAVSGRVRGPPRRARA